MISIVIRNKNEAKLLERTLKILTKFYHDDIDEIILVDNYSNDNSVEIAKSYKCKIIFIDKFTYGKAINMGIESAKNNVVLLLSAHVIPMGNSFFKNSLSFVQNKKKWAGVRFINSAKNFERALEYDFEVKKPLDFGLMAACCLVSKEVWEEVKFDDSLPFSEDKEWSSRVTQLGYSIYDINETFFYDIKRDEMSELNRIKNETLAHFKLHSELKFPNKLKLLLSFIKKISILNTISYFKTMKRDFMILKIKFWIANQLNKKDA
ncbi:glycosyltransferase [Flavobacterium columnare]|uniref:Glycosyltransferase n=2 Tax=Flavobacterium columnare TaxID=996 RepID=A0A437UDV4_9FLAO|nr:glycosyltransferase [Flavobacterium columnare]RVU91820.1 glycosyltransferase [Flavobacterium columnare]